MRCIGEKQAGHSEAFDGEKHSRGAKSYDLSQLSQLLK